LNKGHVFIRPSKIEILMKIDIHGT